ncbi:hydrogenase 4 subunit F [Caminibacter mediatlanticus TB-2]|uniref:Hydrogenase 4 subunit F n=1 Tax=Caminibacter mediatlanticus TB-2 TaxID=391592 RepID=A0ABX5VAJ4_9BACT|nr:hydrogenase 4 subunit F [Caminibacter mediatlanticus]QCT95206.1 hydrogenase 4 subunit F [Caminibacter mediatlanticus TB-2]
MDVGVLIVAMLLIPLIGAIVIWFLPENFGLVSTIHALLAVVELVLTLNVVSFVIDGSIYFTLHKYLILDPIAGVFLTLIAIVGFLVNMYAINYMKWDIQKNELNLKEVKLYYGLMHLFIFTMMLSVVSNNIAIMWAAVEATTLSSVFMVAIYKNKRAVESGWKYIIICSVGLAFALYGTVLMYGAGYNAIGDSENPMFWSNLMASANLLNPDALKVVFIFVLIGFGTKAGLAPMHTWLPDVHSEGPSPTSAILSAVLLKCAIAAILRYYSIIGHSSVGFGYVETLFLVVGLLSIFIAALFIIRQRDIKRMFAYHSVEHVGIIAVGFGVGGPLGVFAALFHTMAHSLSKALAFCASGNIIKIYGTRDMEKMGGLVKINPLVTTLFAVAIFSLIGIPLLAVFVSEFLIIKAGIFTSEYLQIVLFIIGLAIIFIAVLAHFNEVAFGNVRGEVKTKKVETSANLPLIILAILIFTFGVYKIDSWYLLLSNAVKIILG